MGWQKQALTLGLAWVWNRWGQKRAAKAARRIVDALSGVTEDPKVKAVMEQLVRAEFDRQLEKLMGANAKLIETGSDKLGIQARELRDRGRK